MTDLDQLVKSAFDDVPVPDDAVRAARDRIESLRAESLQGARPAAVPSADVVRAAEPPRRTHRRVGIVWRAAAAAAACFVLVALGFGAVNLYREPIAFVGIDVNPSIELGLNRLGIVVETAAINDDGRVLLEGVSLEGRAYDEALAALTASESFAPYAQEESFIEISVTSDDARLAERLRSQSDACLSGLACRGVCHEVEARTRQAAAEAGMGVGRYLAALELMELDPEATLEECSTMSMRQLRDRIAQLSPDGKGSEGQAQSDGGGHTHRRGGMGAHTGGGRAGADG